MTSKSKLLVPSIKYDKLAGSRAIRGAVWAVMAVLVAPETQDVIDVGPDPLMKGAYAAVIAVVLSRVTSFVSRRFGSDPNSTLIVDPPTYTTSGTPNAAG